LLHAIKALRAGGVTDVVVVTGYKAETIAVPGVATRHNPDFARTNMVASLFSAEDVLDGDDVLVVYGDIVFAPRIIRALAADDAPISVAVNRRWLELWSIRMPDPLADAESLVVDAADNLVEIGKRTPSLDRIQGQYAGLIHISPAALPAVRRFWHSLDPERLFDGRPPTQMFMTSFLQEIADHLMPVHAVWFDGGWAEIDTPEDLLAYERLPVDFFD